MRLLTWLLAFALFLPVPATAQDDPNRLEARAADIVAAMKGEKPLGEVYNEAFNEAMPEAEVRAITRRVTTQFGAVIGVESIAPTSDLGGAIRIRFERAIADGVFQLEDREPYKVAGFRITGYDPINDSPDALSEELQALPGEVGVLVADLDGAEEPLIAIHPDDQFAIGSTFKLYVLSALGRSVAAGEHTWDEVVPLTVRSFPSGQTQNWPDRAPVTLHTLATLMISISDNTATDQLIDLLGRDAVETELRASGHSDPDATLPFMTTREMFVLKSGQPELLREYAAKGVQERLAALRALAREVREEGDVNAAFESGPNNIGIEWFASARDIGRIFERIRSLDDGTALGILGVHPSMNDADRADWGFVGYKGGSEPGVLNLSWLLRDKSGQWKVLTMSWNNPEAALDQRQFELLAMRALALAKGN